MGDAEVATLASSNGSTPVVQLEGVQKSFGDHLVLDGIDLEVRAGEVLVIIGPSGSGKSTLLRCVNLLEPVDGRPYLLRGRGDHRQGHRPLRGPASHRHRLPAVQSLPAPEGDRQPHARTAAPLRLAPRARRRNGRIELLAPRRASGEGAAVPASALGRPAAACRDRPRADDGAARDALRRGHLRARPGARGRGARS